MFLKDIRFKKWIGQTVFRFARVMALAISYIVQNARNTFVINAFGNHFIIKIQSIQFGLFNIFTPKNDNQILGCPWSRGKSFRNCCNYQMRNQEWWLTITKRWKDNWSLNLRRRWKIWSGNINRDWWEFKVIW